MRIVAFSAFSSTNYKAECLAEFDGPVTVTDEHGDVYEAVSYCVSETTDGDRLLRVDTNHGYEYLFIETIRQIEGE